MVAPTVLRWEEEEDTADTASDEEERTGTCHPHSTAPCSSLHNHTSTQCSLASRDVTRRVRVRFLGREEELEKGEEEKKKLVLGGRHKMQIRTAAFSE